MTEKYSELKRLAEAATPGPWVKTAPGEVATADYEADGEIMCDHITSGFGCGGSDPDDAAFVAAANPAAVLALIAENDDLALQGRSAREVCVESQGTILSLISERDQLKAVNFDYSLGKQAQDEEVSQLRAENAGLKTGYAAYEEEVKGLRGQLEVMEASRNSVQMCLNNAMRSVAKSSGVSSLSSFSDDLAALRKDAERYRFMRNCSCEFRSSLPNHDPVSTADYDAECDAAMSKEASQ